MALQLAPLVFVRPGELRAAEWSEMDFFKAEWHIPAIKMKMPTKHIVPLSRQAISVIRDIHPLTGAGRYVFPSPRNSQRPLSAVALLAALRRMGYEQGTVTVHPVVGKREYCMATGSATAHVAPGGRLHRLLRDHR
jgi:integrase